jgi:hypothetical protein
VGILSREANRAAAGAWYHLARKDGERLEDGREPKGVCWSGVFSREGTSCDRGVGGHGRRLLAAGDAQGGGAEPLVWHAVSTSHHDRPPKKGLKDAGREAPNEQVRMIVEDGGTVAGAHIGEGRTVLAVGGPPEHDPGAGR